MGVSLGLLLLFLGSGVVSVSVGPNCRDPLDVGHGSEKQLKFHYDRGSGSCQPFFYGGEGGNANRHDSDRDCVKTCSEKHLEIYPDTDQVCSLKQDHGSCFGAIPMFYYDSEEKNCRTFLYGGCHGNGNRFTSREECQKTCLARSGRLLGSADLPNPDQKTVDAGLIVGVVGGVVFAVAIISAVVMLVLHKKNKKTERRKVPTSDIEMK